MSSRFVLVAAAVALAVLQVSAVLAADPADKCQAGKLKESAKYASCRLKAEAKGVLKGLGPDFSKCTAKFPSKFNDKETKAGPGICVTEGDGAAIDALITGDANTLATLLAGGTPADCDADLAACLASFGNVLLKTGQTTCYDPGGSMIACAGTGQDGELQKGIARSFTDNGDGTITDNVTGLMWEKLSDDGTIHDKDNLYTWTNAFETKVAILNSTSFAGYNDWRVPNIREVQTLVNFGAVDPSAYSTFNSGCAAACTVLTCSCTQSNRYWSSSTYQFYPSFAWYVYFIEGNTLADFKTGDAYVRAVRGGP